MPTKRTELFNEDGEDLGVEATVNTTDTNRPGEDYSIEDTPGGYLRFFGHFKNLPSYLRKIWSKLKGE